MTTKKTLIAQYHIDVTLMDDAVIEAYKTLLRHGAKSVDVVEKIDFEVLYSNEQSAVDRMLQSVRSEFLKNDTSNENEAEIKASEKSDGLMGFLKLLRSEDPDEDEDEAEDDEDGEDEAEGKGIVGAFFQGLLDRIIGNIEETEEAEDSDEH